MQIGLLVKAVMVAILGEEVVWPGSLGEVGLVYMFGSICGSLLGLFIEMLSATALVTGALSFTSSYPHLPQSSSCARLHTRERLILQFL